MENIKCPNCGTEINEGEKFCKKCGEKTIYFKETIEKKEKLSKNKIIIIGVSVAVIIVLAAIGIISSKDKTEKVNKEEIKIEETEKKSEKKQEKNKENNKKEEEIINEETVMLTETPVLQQNNEPVINEENVVTENTNNQEPIKVKENEVKEEPVQNQPQNDEPIQAEPQKEEYVKYIVNKNVYQSPYCNFSYTVPVGWTMLNEQQISEIVAPPTEKSIYEFVAQDNENSVLIKVYVEKLDNENMTANDYMNFIAVSVNSSGMKKIANDKTKEIAGKTYNVLELGLENSDARTNCYVRKKDDRVICIMASFNAGKENIVERDLGYFKEF